MQTHNHAIYLARAAAFAIVLIVPTVSTLLTTAYADNESAGAIAPPYQAAGNDKAYADNESAGAIAPSYKAAGNDKAQSTLCGPAVSAKSDVLGAGGQQDELARKIYRPGVSDR